MNIYPAIDIKDGKCVRLVKGDPAAATIYGDDPVAMAERWAKAGATHLHVVDLDGAFEGEPVNQAVIKRILAAVKLRVEVGGGLRDMAHLQDYKDAGAARLILGTKAVTGTGFLKEACRRFKQQVAVAVDLKDGQPRVEGWVKGGKLGASSLIERAAEYGAGAVIITDVGRDGTLKGADLDGMGSLAAAGGVDYILSGGIGSLADVEKAAAIKDQHFLGLIIGKALYDGRVELGEALKTASARRGAK